MRSREQVETRIEKGAARVVVGTLAARDPQLVKELANRYPDQIVLAADVWQGQLMTDGWTNPAAIQPEDFIASFADVPLAGVLSRLGASTKHHVIAAGTVHEPDDVARLKYLPQISGTLIGRALFSKAVDLAEAIATARPEPEPSAEFI